MKALAIIAYIAGLAAWGVAILAWVRAVAAWFRAASHILMGIAGSAWNFLRRRDGAGAPGGAQGFEYHREKFFRAIGAFLRHAAIFALAGGAGAALWYLASDLAP
jgi:hypothetical protein